MKRQPKPIAFFSDENFEDMITHHQANIWGLRNEQERLRYILEIAPAPLCKRYGIEPLEEAEDTLQAILRADKAYQRESYRVSRIQAFLDGLSTEEAEYIKLRYFQGKQWSEVAKVLFLSIGSVRTRWKRRLLDRAKKMMVAEIINKEG